MARKRVYSTKQLVNRFGAPVKSSTDWFTGANMNRTQVARPQTTHDTRQDMTDTTRHLMMGLSRWLYWNTPIGQVIDERANECIGEAWEPRYLGANKDWGRAATNWFSNWGMACDVTGRLTYWDHLELGIIEHHRDGDGFRMFVKGKGGYPLLQAIPSHRVGKKYESDTVGGIIPNPRGRPVAYRVSVDDPRERASAQFDGFVDVPAFSVHHIFAPKFVDQYRGMPAVVRGARTLTDQHDIVEFEKVAVKMASSIGLIRSDESGKPADAFDVTSKASVLGGSLPLYEFAAGAMPTIPKDALFESFQSNRPGNTWQGFMQYLSRLALMSMGSRYEYAFDPSSLSGPAMRFVMRREDRAIAKDQWLIEKFARRVWGFAVGSAANLGLIPPLPADWWNISFSKPKANSIDIGREATAEQNDYLLGWKTRSEHLSEQGIDPDAYRLNKKAEVGALLADASEIAAEYDIPLTTALSLFEERKLIVQSPAAPATTEEKPQ